MMACSSTRLNFAVTALAGCIWMPGLRCGAAEPEIEPAGQLLERPIEDWEREHWSLQPIRRPELPAIQSAGQARNAIDHFILQQLEQSGLQLARPASPQELLRRLKFDLLGLPPTPSERQRFLADQQPGAYERLVDRLLSAPAYGERWAQHWLDLARFAETDGFEWDKVREGAWRYRDWVISALNSDMPYDRFVRYQLAGDVMQPARDDEWDEHTVATTFCLAGPDMPDINEQDLRRHDKLNELTSTIGSALLGLQFHCAQCHDHKYDPISQADFYRLRAVFESCMPLMQRDKHVLVLSQQNQPPIARLYFRGELNRPGPTLSPGLPRAAVPEGVDYLCSTSTPRLEFCDWLFDRTNPLTARVMANRIWLHHFGRSLPQNPSDFGVIAGEPTHPQLLDWLACELIDSGWSVKHLHRLILNSATYRQASFLAEGDPAQAADPDNNRYSRYPRRRLEGEVIRDTMLAVSGQLNGTMHGESVYPPLPPELVSTLLKGQWETSPQAEDRSRRSIYTFARRNLRYPLFDVFDRPDAGASCAIRGRSTTALQSLQMLNSDFTLECARALSQRLLEQYSLADRQQRCPLIDDLFLRCLSRPARPSETLWLEEHLTARGAPEENLLSACIALFNSSEFIYVD